MSVNWHYCEISTHFICSIYILKWNELLHELIGFSHSSWNVNVANFYCLHRHPNAQDSFNSTLCYHSRPTYSLCVKHQKGAHTTREEERRVVFHLELDSNNKQILSKYLNELCNLTLTFEKCTMSDAHCILCYEGIEYHKSCGGIILIRFFSFCVELVEFKNIPRMK